MSTSTITASKAGWQPAEPMKTVVDPAHWTGKDLSESDDWSFRLTESEIAELEDEEKAEFLAELGLEEPGLDRVIRAGYELLGLHTYFTAGEKEVRAWTVKVGATAPEAAGVIHTAFQKGFTGH